MRTEIKLLTLTKAARLAGINPLRLLWLAWRRHVTHWRFPGSWREPLVWRFVAEDPKRL